MYVHIRLFYMYALNIIDFAKESNDLYRLYPEQINDFIGSPTKNCVFIASKITDSIFELYKAKFLFSYEIGIAVDKLADEFLLIIKKCRLSKDDPLDIHIESLKLIIKNFEDEKIWGKIGIELYIEE